MQEQKELVKSMLDRLALNAARIEGMADGLRQCGIIGRPSW